MRERRKIKERRARIVDGRQIGDVVDLVDLVDLPGAVLECTASFFVCARQGVLTWR